MTPTEPPSPTANVRFGQPSGAPTGSSSFGRSGTLVGLVLIALIVAGVVWSAAGSNATAARRPQLFAGSLVLEDSRPLSVVDLATAAVTVRLPGIDQQVDARSYSDVATVPVDGGTILVNRRSGTFNLLQHDNFVLDAAGAGVGLGRFAGSTGARGYGAGSDAYIVRTAAKSTVSLVGEQTVAQAARLDSATVAKTKSAPTPAVAPLGFAALPGSVGTRSGLVAVSGHDLWVLSDSGGGCQVLQLRPAPLSRQGLAVTDHGSTSAPCARASLIAGSGEVGVASPGRLTVFGPQTPGKGRLIPVPATSPATAFLPVVGGGADLWYLARSNSGWSLHGVTESGEVIGPEPLVRLGPAADPVAPVLSGGNLYTLDQAADGQPTLWVIDPGTGNMAPVAGAATYPAFSVTEKAPFDGAEVLVDGPRVVFNNPQSLEAVVVFTDGSHRPAIVDKTAAVAISATGPADLAAGPPVKGKGTSGHPRSQPGRPTPVVQPVNPLVSCRNTTQKPYAPQITSVNPSSQSATVAWSYQLLDQNDCEPDSWSVQMTAISSSRQPRQPIQFERGQEQYLFTGLRPQTTYRSVVTAYINKQSTGSPPVTFTTPARGPDAPISVSTRSDGHGNWVVSWTPCTEAANPNCVVPAAVWTITGSACASSFVPQPPSVQVPGSRTSVTIPSDSFGLLGDSLSFSVQGSLASGLAGNPTADPACVEAWRPPNRSAISVTDAGAEAADGRTITATVQVNTTGTPVEAFGSRSTEFVYRLAGHVVGPTSQTKVQIPGLAGGQSYTPTVSVYPAGHPAAAITVAGPAFSRNLSWPADLAASVASSVESTDPNQGSLAVTFPGLPSGPMSASGSYTCGSTQSQQVAGPVVSGTFHISISLIDYGGACVLSVTLTDTATPDPYGVSSPQLTTTFTIGTQPAYQFSAQIAPDCQQNFCAQQQVEVDYSGSGQPTAGGDWSISSSSPADKQGIDTCASTVTFPDGIPQFPQIVTLPLLCDWKNVDITVSYKYLGTTVNQDAGSLNGTPATTTTTASTTTTTVCSTGSSPTTTCTSGGSVAAAFVERPAGSRALAGAVEWGGLGLGAGWAASWVRRYRNRSRRDTNERQP